MFNNKNYKIKKLRGAKKGSVLLLSLLVMSIIMAGSVALGAIIISGIRQARSIDNSIVAYYAAESGVEESLYKIRKMDVNLADDISNTEATFDNGASWRIGAYGEDIKDTQNSFQVDKLPKNKFVEFDVYYTGEGSEKIKSLLLSGMGDMIERLQVSWFGYKTSGSTTAEDLISAFKQKEFSHSMIAPDDNGEQSGAPLNLTEGIGDYDAYRVKVKALCSDVDNLEIRAFTDTAASQPESGTPLPARVVASVHGDYRGSRQTLRYAMPRQSPLGGLFDFVLFSECSILKGLSEECL